MKKYLNKLVVLVVILAVVSCDNLDRFPLDNPSSKTFFSNQVEMETAVNRLYTAAFFEKDSERWGDNEWSRSPNGNNFLAGTNTSQSTDFSGAWSNSYTAVNRANVILENIDKPNDYKAGVKDRIEGEAKFTRAYNYALLAIRFKNVPLILRSISTSEALNVAQSPQEEVLNFVFQDLDDAIALLPESYSGVQRITKGAALALKARIALYTKRYAVAAAAAKQIMDAKRYELYPSYRDLFLAPGQTSKEIVFSLPRSLTFAVTYDVQYDISRLAGGYASNIPVISLIDSFECTDGLTIDKSPLYNVNQPFENRDPRLRASIVVPGDQWLGYVFNSRPSAAQTIRLSDNKLISNQDSQAVNAFPSFTGLLKKKGIPNDPAINWKSQDFDYILIRYAEVLLTYAEAKIELNEIDQTVLDAINTVRARAYGVSLSNTSNYPALTSTNQSELRRSLRRERRVEFCFEGLRYRDILRWEIAPEVFNKSIYGYPKTETPGWPIGGVPTFDENDIPNYSAFGSNLNIIYTTVFDPQKHYLWAIPFGEFTINNKLQQNPGY
ncbi:RagB/SusD family nutrient uptake outer membrane protein [Flavobacterium sp. LPB0248]|uniref:RagB/SusD family nutrient uptake outer membrane protein n=1 Tax=Flavobacterium sp. LPB0248 TaxID=2614441 RepID=UPI0015A7234C|nr:RagB/SusD family nutrient uptake outer membrane protein [Flavobacterium sp. LPB0248]QLC64784.1 RagB/SusD family nutrient uptake outer membrane protein [Flavobacterium sp. LPB0248]